MPEKFLRAIKEQRCQKTSEVRRSNRFVLQRVFRDLFVGDRLEIQTRKPGFLATTKVDMDNWDLWKFHPVWAEDFHYAVDPQTGVIRWERTDGRVPGPSEAIRARFYRYSQLEKAICPRTVNGLSGYVASRSLQRNVKTSARQQERCVVQSLVCLSEVSRFVQRPLEAT